MTQSLTDDIVTRLRVYASVSVRIVANELNEAADEIERLRAELERWQLIAKTLGDGYSLTAEQRPALQAVYEKFYANSPEVMEAI